MAEKKNEKFSIKDLNAENVSEQLENAGKYGKDIIEMAKKNREEKDKERAARDFDELSQKAEYFNYRLCLMAKMFKTASKACDDIRNKSLELFKRVESGELDAIGFDNEQKKLAKEFTKDIDKIYADRKDDDTRLRNKYPSGNWWSWDNELFNTITDAMRRITQSK